MVIYWYGQACFRIQSGDLVIAIDPFSKEIGLTPPRFRADIVLVTHSHYDHSNVESIPASPFLISGPGEYEVGGVYVLGMETFHDKNQGRDRGMNTMYVIEVEGLRLLHMGDFGEEALRSETLDAVGSIDILMIPVGGTYTVDGEGASRIVKQVEPRFVVPMHYKTPGLKINLAGVEEFLKEMGASQKTPEDKFVVKKRDLGEDEKTEVILLKPA